MENKFIYKLKQLKTKINYNESLEIIKKNKITNYHLGQLKLFMSELLFLSKFIHNKNILVLYVGAAGGYHTHYMATIFPHFMFELYDKNPFHEIFEKKKLNNIKIFHEYFTDELAIKYKNYKKNILFMCDMRDLEIKNVSDNIDDLDKLIIDDMNSQMNWAKTMLPIATYLKFRLPYKIPKITYFSGSIYLQPYNKNGTETRLLIRNYNKTKKYYCIENDEKMAYFNCCIRTLEQNTIWKDILEKNNIVNNWDNNYALYIIRYYLKKKYNTKPTNDEVIKTFLDIIKYHQKSNDRKYDIIFN